MANRIAKDWLAIGLAGLAVAALAATFFASCGATQTSSSAYTISGNTPGFIKQAVDLGSADLTTVISVTVWLNLHNEKQLDRLVEQQYQKGSPSFCKWITQDTVNASFSPSHHEVKSVEDI